MPLSLLAELSGERIENAPVRIAWANDAALAMHGVASLDDLGSTVDVYRARFSLRYRNNQAPGRYPIERVVDGETFRDVVVEVRHAVYQLAKL